MRVHSQLIDRVEVGHDIVKANEEEGSEFHIDRDTMVGHMK